jgi:hypothetical protein
MAGEGYVEERKVFVLWGLTSLSTDSEWYQDGW